MNIEAKFFNKILATQIEVHIIRITHQWDLSLGCKDVLTYTNQQTQ